MIDRFQVALQTVNCCISRKANKKEILGGKVKALDACYKFMIGIFALKSFSIFETKQFSFCDCCISKTKNTTRE